MASFAIRNNRQRFTNNSKSSELFNQIDPNNNINRTLSPKQFSIDDQAEMNPFTYFDFLDSSASPININDELNFYESKLIVHLQETNNEINEIDLNETFIKNENSFGCLKTISSGIDLYQNNAEKYVGTVSSDLTVNDKKSRSKQLKLEKKRIAEEKRLIKQKERETKRMKKESLRKYRQDLKTEIREAKESQSFIASLVPKSFYSNRNFSKYSNRCNNNKIKSNSNTSLNRDLEQFANYNHFNKSASFSNAQTYKIQQYQLPPTQFQSSYDTAEILKLPNQSTDSFYYSTNSSMHSNEAYNYSRYSCNQIQPNSNFKLEPFKVNISYQTDSIYDSPNKINEGSRTTNIRELGYDFIDFNTQIQKAANEGFQEFINNSEQYSNISSFETFNHFTVDVAKTIDVAYTDLINVEDMSH